MVTFITEPDVSLGRLSQAGEWDVKTIAHDVVYHHLAQGTETVDIFSIFDLTLVCFFIATSNLLLASMDILALSFELSLTLSMAWHQADASG